MTLQDTSDFLEFLWIWNNAHNLPTPALHRRIARWLSARDAAHDRRLALTAFRGSGKSTLVGLWSAWLLARTPETRILVLAADQLLAGKMVTHVRRIVERHPLCLHLLPDSTDAWAADRFTVARDAALRDASMRAQGITGNITGDRAEYVICDDVEVAGNCDTEAKRAELRERLAETEFVLTPTGTLLFIGTPHTTDSLYKPSKHPDAFLRSYRRLAIPILTPTGKSAWPDRFPLDAIESLRTRVGPTQFRRQMLLEAIADQAARLDPAALIPYAEHPLYSEAQGRPQLTLLGRRLVSGGGFWDPAFGRARGDSSVLAALYADNDGAHFIHRLAYLTIDPDHPDDPATQQCRQVAEIARDLLLPIIRVETNGLGQFLPALLRRELARAGAACTVLEHTSRRAKDDRILAAIEPALAARKLHAHTSLFTTPFPQEMAVWRPNTPNRRDDALDAIAGCLLAEPVRLARAAPMPRRADWRSG